MRDHPYVELLRDRGVRTLWMGLALSALGSEVYRVGAIWLAVSIAGAQGAYLASAQMAAILLMSMFGGGFAGLVSRRFLLVGSDLARAAFSFLIVTVAMSASFSLPVLILTTVVLASFGALFNPTLQASLPQLIAERVRLRATNGLFDATTRFAQVIGPSLAAALIAILPVVHLLTANGLSFLASAGAIALVGRRLDGDAGRGTIVKSSIPERLLSGVRAANGCPGAWRILLTTMVRGAAVALGFSVGIPLFFVQRQHIGWGFGVTAVALVFGACAAGELGSNLIMAAAHPKRPWRAMFSGYMTIGASLALMGATELFAPPSIQVPGIIGFALLMGLGNSMAGMQMTTFLGARLGPEQFAAVLRLRATLITAAAMIATAAGPWALQAVGSMWTILGCGLAVAAVSAVSLMSPAHNQMELAPLSP